MESVELSTLALENGKKNCGFCQIKTNTLYDLAKTVPFYVLQRIFPFDILVKNTDAVFMILETRLYELAPKFIRDVIEGLFSPTAGGGGGGGGGGGDYTSTATTAGVLTTTTDAGTTTTIEEATTSILEGTTTTSIGPTTSTTTADNLDIVAFQSSHNGSWFSVDSSALPTAQLNPDVQFDIKDSVVNNRKNGQISPTLLSGYFFIQWNISRSELEKYADTIKALFLRSALMNFVDYPNNRVLWWDRTSSNISSEIQGIIRLCNEKKIPVFLGINYSDYIPGAIGTGVESLQHSDNIANTITFLNSLNAAGLFVDGVTFGDEIENDSGYGSYKPTIWNSDLIGIYISYASAIKSSFPMLKIYAFDSFISAARGRVSMYWDLFERIRQAELIEGKNLIDGFTFRESYVYIDQNNNVLESQFILDDTESLYRDTPVYRYDVDGTSHPNPDTAYLPLIVSKTNEIFGRSIDIGITEYLPAGPIQISESDTSNYSDIDFIIHFSDIVGIYAQLGLDIVSKIMFGDSINMHKSYFDRNDNLGPNYPEHEQLAQYFAGEILNVDRSVDYDSLKVKVYATRKDTKYFIVILNKDVNNDITVRITFPIGLDLKIHLPRRSYTSLRVDGNNIIVSGIGN